MDEATARALADINRRFYRERAAEFSARREAPWPGWQRVWQVFAERAPDDLRERPEVLDVGCGNGRFGRFLAERAPGLRYVGVDASPELLAIARSRGGLGESPQLHEVDLLEDAAEARLGALAAQHAPAGFALVTLFGVVHHLPGATRRRALLAGLLGLLRPGGLLCATWWQFQAFARFRRRLLTWEAYNRGAATPIDPAALEPGDGLLPWEEGPGVRYVHFADTAEMAALLADLAADPGAEVVADFESDGREGGLNRYLLLRPRVRPVAGPGARPW